MSSSIPLPKHIPFPDLPWCSELKTESIAFLSVFLAACMQFVTIYRTVWWLPESYTHHTVNIHLIDPHLAMFIFVVISRRLIYSLMNISLDIVCRRSNKDYKDPARIIFIVIFTCLLGYCLINIFSRHNYFCLFLLLLPIAIYLKFFGFRIEPLLRITNEMGTSYLNGIPMHCCWTNPSAVREEVEILRSDFNFRLKQAFFISVINAYYAGFLPCFFAQNFIYYDIVWVTEHTILIWYTTFVMYVIFCYPPKYFDVLQSAALHLGEWIEIDECPSNQTPQKWSKSISWPAGSIVRCSGKLYVSSGLVTSSIPGNSRELSFVGLYNDPRALVSGTIVSCIHSSFTILLILLLCFTVEWHTILSLSFLIMANCHSLFYISIYFNIAEVVHRMVTQKSMDIQLLDIQDVVNSALKQYF